MEGVISPTDQQAIVFSFLEIAEGQTTETGRQFLQPTGWKLEEAIQLFYVGNDVAPMVAASNFPPPENLSSPANHTSVGLANDNGNASIGQEDEVRPPLPVIREALYDDAMVYGAPRTGFTREASSVVAFRNFGEEMRRDAVWQSDQGGGTATADNIVQDLASLYRPPFELMHRGSFDEVYDDSSEGRKVCTYYKVDSVPTILVIDPITGQKMRAWSGMVHPDRLLKDLIQFMDGGPRDHHVSISQTSKRRQFCSTTKVSTFMFI